MPLLDFVGAGQSDLPDPPQDLLVERSLDMLCKRIFPSPGSHYAKLLLSKCYNLNPCRSKRLHLGLDFESKFKVCMVLENTSGRVCLKLSEEDWSFIFEPSWIVMTDRHMKKPYTMPGPVNVSKTLEVRLFQVQQMEPAMKISTPDNNYIVMGAVTWDALKRQRPLIEAQRKALYELVSSQKIPRLFINFTKQMVELYREVHKDTPFNTENEAIDFIRWEGENGVCNMLAPEPLSDFLLEVCFAHTSLFARTLLDAVNEKLLDNVKV